MDRTERQAHGFLFEEYVESTYGIDRSNKTYTDKWDGEWKGFPVSIKHIKKGNAIDLGDIFRQASINEDFFMFIDFYETQTVSETDEIHILFLPAKSWQNYFMPIEKFELKFKNALSSVSNNKEDDQKWTELRKDCIKFWKDNTSGFITPNGKRDHRSQKRWQCSINKTNFFKEFLPKYEITKEEFYATRNKK
jgi:hypothetical protein